MGKISSQTLGFKCCAISDNKLSKMKLYALPSDCCILLSKKRTEIISCHFVFMNFVLDFWLLLYFSNTLSSIGPCHHKLTDFVYLSI